jgi:hypothetical protein
MANILAVRAHDYAQQVSPLPFIGLPREELERLLGAVEVLSLAKPEPGYLPLTAYAALHYNYRWLAELDGPGSLGKQVPLHTTAEPPLFLDDKLHNLARTTLAAAGLPDVPCDWRCAGIAQHADTLALVYVVRLRQRWEQQTLRVISSGELQTDSAAMDPIAQLISQNLSAF